MYVHLINGFIHQAATQSGLSGIILAWANELTSEDNESECCVSFLSTQEFPFLTSFYKNDRLLSHPPTPLPTCSRSVFYLFIYLGAFTAANKGNV